MAVVAWALLLFHAQLHSLLASSALASVNQTHHSPPTHCLPDQADALLKLKHSFYFDHYSTTTLPSWQAGTDCCLWEGVGCSSSSGHVTALNLGGFELNSQGIDPVLFNLTYLRVLDLSMNDFLDAYYDDIPSDGFERLTLLTHLNLSGSYIGGQVPAGIGKLTNLISLDLSYRAFDDLSKYRFHSLVANLTNLRELILDQVLISSRAEDCFKALAKSTPHLRVLSLASCGLLGHIDQSLSSLRYLVKINLGYNYGMTPGPFPEFVMGFLNLSVLQLSDINLEGWFPRGIFQSNNLKVLELSSNPNLLGQMPSFSNASSLEILRLHMTNFSYEKSKSSSNFSSITELGLDGNVISLDLLSLFSASVSLRKLVLTRIFSLRNSYLVFSWMQNIRELRTLVLYNCNFFTETPSSIRHSKNNLTMQALSAVTSLKNLKSLSIGQCDLPERLPSTIGNLSNLESLDIFDSQITGPIPHEVGALKKLTSLQLVGIGLSGRIPSSIGNLTQLTELNLQGNQLGDCQITGPIPHEVGALKKLTSLQLVGIGLSGRIPSSIGNLTQLTKLVLSGNQLSGEIPTSLFTLLALQKLDLYWNQFSGTIPEFNATSSHLRSIFLSNNQLVGPIPQSFFVLTSLSNLDISWNNLTGLVDLTSFWRLENLTYLSLSNNKLSVTDGNSSTYLPRLWGLKLAYCNITRIPNFLTHLNDMAVLDLSSNKIRGNIPKWIWERWNSSLMSLNLSHNMFTGMELSSYVLPLKSHLYSFDISSNRLQGQIPMPSLSAEFFDYSNNIFSSVLPNFTQYLSRTYYLSLSKNNISSYLSNSICDSHIEVLDVSYNNFKGHIPQCLMGNGLLSILNLRGNHFEGAVPSNFSSGCSLQTMDLHGNKIEGQLPRALCNCTDLEVLDLGRNQITDYFPSWLGKLLNLRVLVLRSNQFHGSISYFKDEKSTENFPSLQILDLASNHFSGNLHPQWFETLESMNKYNNTGHIIGYHSNMTVRYYQDVVTISYKGLSVTFERILTTLTVIDLSDNAFEGSIPASIGKLVALHVLNLSHNAFTGEIPREFGGMTALESLDLSSNMLSGKIPQELTNITFLSNLNLSNNELKGRIPQSRQFATFESSSFDGNIGLCGLPLLKQCSSPDVPNEAHLRGSSDSVDIVLFLFIGVGFGVGFAAAVLTELGWIKWWFHNVNSET